ncbi:hypothetical protein [Spiroplasma endosymbiont of Aspidapion aeneum]|uniref:hypothetical protein n=1 Tax=Spiroplasma endosymbiont of Aspidapion aeneum TaxID=3066276 RepID=UPI00313B9574
MIQSHIDFQPIKQQILANPQIVNGQTKYELRPDFFVTKEQLNVYLPFLGALDGKIKFF